jgi:hypothetical protein
MLSSLFDAVARCHARRLLTMASRAPLPAAAVILIVLLAPIAFLRVGRALGAEVSGAIDAAGVADAIVLGPGLAAAVGGATLAAALPERAAFGGQIAAAPFGRIVGLVAVVLPPALAGAVVALPSLTAGGWAVGGELPGGPVSGIALSTAVVAAMFAGAIGAEAAIAASRGRLSRQPALAALAVPWPLVGLLLGAPPLGPLATVPPALRGELPPWVALVGSGATAAGLSWVWVMLAADRPEARAVRSGRTTGRVGRRCLAIPAALAAILLRRRDVRLAAVSSLVLGATGVVLAAVSAAPEPTGLLLATTTALLGCVLCSLVACGALLDGRWLWSGSPGDRRTIVALATIVTLAATAAPVVLVGLAAAAVSGATIRSTGIVAALTIVGSAVALLAGCLVPWKGGGVGDQLATFAAFAAVAFAASLLVGLVAPRLVSRGIPDSAVVLLVCAAATGSAGYALGRKLGSVTR